MHEVKVQLLNFYLQKVIMELPDRIKIVRDTLELSQKDMAKAIGVSLTALQGYEAGRSVPGGDVIKAFVKLGFNANWLLTGEGEMLRGEAATPGADHSGDVNTMVAADPATHFAQDAESEELCRLLKRYGNRALVEDVKARLLKIKQVVEG